MNHPHFVRKCSCSEIIAQCRCMDKNTEEVVIKNGCSKCADATLTPPVTPSNSSDLLNALRDNHEVLIFGKPSKLAGRYEVLFTGPEELMKELLNQF